MREQHSTLKGNLLLAIPPPPKGILREDADQWEANLELEARWGSRSRIRTILSNYLSFHRRKAWGKEDSSQGTEKGRIDRGHKKIWVRGDSNKYFTLETGVNQLEIGKKRQRYEGGKKE